MTGGQVKRIKKYSYGEYLMVTYRDCLADVDLKKLLLSHKNSGKILSVTVVQSKGRFSMSVSGSPPEDANILPR